MVIVDQGKCFGLILQLLCILKLIEKKNDFDDFYLVLRIELCRCLKVCLIFGMNFFEKGQFLTCLIILK